MAEIEALGAVQDRVETLYSAEGDRLWRAVAGFARDAAIADDAVAEAFTQLLGRGDEVRDGAAWVWGAAFKIAAGELKRAGRRVEAVAERAVGDPEPVWGLAAALGRLSDQQRAVVVLRDYAGHSSRATAQILGSTEQSVGVQLSRARKARRKDLVR